MTRDDAKLTSYALNELDDADRAQVEAFLAGDETARRQVEETRQTAALLTQSLQIVQAPGLTVAQRQSIAAAAPAISAPSLPYETARPVFRRAWARWALATAACAALAAGGISALHYRRQNINKYSALTVSPPAVVSLDARIKSVIASLTERSQEQIRKHHLREALIILRQIIELDPTNQYALAAYPSVYTGFQLNPNKHSETRDREVTNSLNSRAQTVPHADVLQYPENWPVIPSDPNETKTASVPDGGVLLLGGQTLPGVISSNTAQTGAIASTGSVGPFVGAKRDSLFAKADSNPNQPNWSSDSVLLPSAEAWIEIPAITPEQQPAAAAPNESYAPIADNPFRSVAQSPLSTFSIDVDTGSYSNIRRFIESGRLPPPDAVRIEEMLNYFPYDYTKPASDSKEPFAAAIEIAGCPWNSAHRLARIAIKGREIARDKRPVSNLVFLIDVSGSMNEPAKLPLVKQGLRLMVEELTENDRISIVVYAGNAGLVLPSTAADPRNKQAILDAIDRLSAGGSTNGGQGIELAYRIASENFIKGGTNRVLLATDGDWNVGITDQSSLTQLIQDKAKSGVFLSVLGYGFGNLKDATMEKLADKGNGHYAYIDNLKESKKVLVEEMSSTLITIAKDVKIQVEFNPARVESYRLLGYEKRLLRKEDFNNDKVDAGEIGAGHCVTALYEIVPGKQAAAETAPAGDGVDPLKYQKRALVRSDDLFTLKLRYKRPDGEISGKIEIPAVDRGLPYAKAGDDFKFCAAVAQFGMILRHSADRGSASLGGVLELADEGKGKDEKGYRGEFLQLVKKAESLMKN